MKLKKMIFVILIYSLFGFTGCNHPQSNGDLLSTKDSQNTEITSLSSDSDESAILTSIEEELSISFSSFRPDYLYNSSAQMPDLSKIDLIWNGDGYTSVIGHPGSIPGSYPVYVSSLNTGSAVIAKSKGDGSFEVEIVAPPASWISVKYDSTENNYFLNREILSDTHTGNVSGALGAIKMVPFEPPKGEGENFVISGTKYPGYLDFTISGTMTGDFRAGGNLLLEGFVDIYPSPEGQKLLEGQIIEFPINLAPIFNQQGKPRIDGYLFMSTILTPTGFPVELFDRYSHNEPLSDGLLVTDELQLDSDEIKLTAPFQLKMSLPSTLPDGLYILWLDTDSISKGDQDINPEPIIESIGGYRALINPVINKGYEPFPPFVIGEPEQPHIVWTLLTDVPDYEGNRGTVAVEDKKDFGLNNHILLQSNNYIIPHISKETGEPITYRLEPYLPMLSQTKDVLMNPPYIAFNFPSGEISVKVTRPDGSIDDLGTSVITTAYHRTPITNSGHLIDAGCSYLGDVLQLSSGTDQFDYQFPDYGEYSVEMRGYIEDVYGNIYDGGGTYSVFIAEPLDLEPATLPMTPFEVGDILNPSLTVLPGVPADVEMSVQLFIESNPENIVDYKVNGKANRFGFFASDLYLPPIEMSGPGEFSVETTAKYLDQNGVLWMGSSRWGQVVATPGNPIIAHGNRGRFHDEPWEAKMWVDYPYIQGEMDGNNFNLPYATGDILWQTTGIDEDKAQFNITIQDNEGLVQSIIKNTNGYGCRDEYIPMQELPLQTIANRNIPAAQVPEEISIFGYYYAGAERSGERIHELVATDRLQLNEWGFNSTYSIKQGVGVDGDLPNDFKFLYGGAVFRDIRRELNLYGIYASLWVGLPEDDERGARVYPPFQGANGGPSGGPIMNIGDEEIDSFVVPLAVRPGTILEVGDTFSFSTQLAPTLPGQVDVTITGPNEFSRKISGRANAIGYFYDPNQNFILDSPGIYQVSVTATFDTPTSVGPMIEPYPTGTVLGAIDNGFDIFVVSPESEVLLTVNQQESIFRGTGEMPLYVELPNGVSGETGQYTIAMPGFLLEAGDLAFAEGFAKILYDPERLAKTFLNIDTNLGRGLPCDSDYDCSRPDWNGVETSRDLVDTVWVSVVAQDDDGIFHARKFTLQGMDVYDH